MKMNKQATKKMHHSIGYTLFVKHDSEYGNEAKVVYDPSFDKIKALEDQGYEFITCGFKTAEQAYEYAKEDAPELNAYPRSCALCHQFAELTNVRGRRFSDTSYRWEVFNGYVCEQCYADGVESGELEVRIIKA